MANSEHLAVLKKAVEARNRWREENPKIRPGHLDADLTETNLGEANLSRADLSGAKLDRAVLTIVGVGYTTFADVDLSQVKGLETAQHLGPSTIGIDTIYRSKGKIPHAFLCGAGVPERFIE